jgi:hypothetical protein
LSEFKVLSKERGVGWGVKKPEETAKTPEHPSKKPASPYQEFAEHLRRNPRSAVIGGHGWGHERFERLKDIDKG